MGSGDFNHGPGSHVLRQIEAHCNADLCSQPGGLARGVGDLPVGVGPFIEKYACAFPQRRPEKVQDARHRGERTGRYEIHTARERQFLGAACRYRYIRHFQRGYGGLEETRLLLYRFGKSEPRGRQCERERNAGESRARTRVDNVFRVCEKPPRHYRIQHVLNGRLVRRNDAGEVQVPVRFLDKRQMARGFGNDYFAVRQVRGQYPVQFLFSFHVPSIMSPSEEMSAAARRRKILEEAWIGDAVLCLYARSRILRTDGAVDSAKFERMTSNRFLAAVGEPSEVEAEIGRVYRAEGIEAAFAWIEQKLVPLFDRQEEKRMRREGVNGRTRPNGRGEA